MAMDFKSYVKMKNEQTAPLFSLNTAGEKAEFQFKTDIIEKRKEAALESGEITDFSFLVGPEGNTELMHCFKSDLLLASDYFGAMLRSPLSGPLPIRIKHVQPHIFKIILNFITFHRVKSVSNVSDAVALLSVADEFLMDKELQQFFQSELERLVVVENVWQTLTEFQSNPHIHSACSKVLSSQTRESLKQPSFLDISKEGLICLLQMDTLGIQSETELVDACLKLANKQQTKQSGYELMRAALPYLRLLTLNASEIEPMLDYLTETEQSYLSNRLCWKEKFAACSAPDHICPIIFLRKSPEAFSGTPNSIFKGPNIAPTSNQLWKPTYTKSSFSFGK